MPQKIYARKTKSGKAIYFIVGNQQNRYVYYIAISQLERLLKDEQRYVNVNVRKARPRKWQGESK